ncbi:MAG: hypothetical protein PHV99_01615 [Candidatus Pacebacteria bacterium]|nr:hypothetical protein [Candidatus Paceibacterota bacterium]
MSRSSTLVLLGILTILTPFSGLPITFRSLVAVICGAWVLGIGFSMRVHEVHKAQAPLETPPAPPAPPTGVSPI